MKKILSVGEVCERSGVAVSALHFYEKKGLIHSTRNQGNQRRYSRDVLRVVSIIKVAQSVGLPLAEIKLALDTLPNNRTPSADDWATLSEAWRDKLDKQISNLNKIRSQLDSCIGCGCLSLEICPVRNPNDKAFSKGAGARAFD